jgi:poly(3-hydroxyalkanoate) synthetase
MLLKKPRATKEDNVQVAKRIPGNRKLTLIEDAPGSYVEAKVLNVANK